MIIMYRDNGIDSDCELESKHMIRFFDSTGEGRLFYVE